MKITLVAYYYPPTVNVAAQRWGQFVEILQARGHEVSVISGPSSAGVSEGEARSRGVKKLAFKILPVFLLIDRRFFWSLKVFNLLWQCEVGRTNGNEILIVTCPPWSALVSASLYSKLFNVKLVVDCRDLWSTEPALAFGSKLARLYFSLIEKWALRHAQKVMTVNEPLLRHYQSISSKKAVAVLPNGFKGTLKWSVSSFNDVRTHDKAILYAGTVSTYHGVKTFLEACRSLASPEIVFMGKDALGLLTKFKVTKRPAMPAPEADLVSAQAGVLLLTLDRTSAHSITGKIMSYIKAGRPILYFGPLKSPAARLISEQNLGWVVDCESPSALSRVMGEIAEHFQSERPFEFKVDPEVLNQFSLENLGSKLESVLTAL